MPIAANLFVPRQSWVHALDPRVKLLFVACAIIVLLVFNNLFFMLAALTSLLLIYRAAKIPLKNITFVLKTLLPVTMTMTVLWMLFYPAGTLILQIWLVKITVLGIAQGLVLALRINVMAFAVFAWLYTTDQPSLVRSLVKLRMPYEWGLVLALALRYIPTFQETYSVISQAQQARGLEISSGSGFRRVRVMMPIFVAMIISSLRASDELARALESRALGLPGVQRTTLRDIYFRPRDYLFITLILTMITGLLYLRIRYGFATHPLNIL